MPDLYAERARTPAQCGVYIRVVGGRFRTARQHGFSRIALRNAVGVTPNDRLIRHIMCEQENTLTVSLDSGKWLNKPSQFTISKEAIQIVTDPNTDLWQRSYYGFRNDNAPALLFNSDNNFTFTAKVSFQYKKQFDQCGLLIYIDSNNWFKSSIEFENESFSRLGSVVTNGGYSDWATSDISLPSEIWYRLSRRGPDFLIEHSLDGLKYKQMRIFHLHGLGETTEDMGKANPPLPAKHSVQFGIYACSPGASTFVATFTGLKIEPCSWLAHTPTNT